MLHYTVPELETKVHKVFTIPEKTPLVMAYSLLKAANTLRGLSVIVKLFVKLWFQAVQVTRSDGVLRVVPRPGAALRLLSVDVHLVRVAEVVIGLTIAMCIILMFHLFISLLILCYLD